MQKGSLNRGPSASKGWCRCNDQALGATVASNLSIRAARAAARSRGAVPAAPEPSDGHAAVSMGRSGEPEVWEEKGVAHTARRGTARARGSLPLEVWGAGSTPRVTLRVVSPPAARLRASPRRFRVRRARSTRRLCMLAARYRPAAAPIKIQTCRSQGSRAASQPLAIGLALL